MSTVEMIRPIWYLKQFDLLKNLPDTELQLLDRATTLVHSRKGDVLYYPEDPSNSIFLIKKGVIEICRVFNGKKEIPLMVIGPGEIVGELALVDEQRRDCLARVKEDSLLCKIGKDDFEAFLRSHADLALEITRLMGVRRKEIETRIEELVCLGVASRVARVLQRLMGNYGKDSEYGMMFTFKLTHRDIAGLAGTTRETVSALISQWKKLGILSPETKRIVIADQAKLQEIALTDHN